MSQQWSIGINPVGCFNQLIEAVHGHLANLKTVLRAIDDGSFRQLAQTPSPNAMMKLHVMDAATSPEGAAQRATVTCFKGMLSEFISFLDRMIATREFIKDGTIIVDRSLTGEEQINAYVQQKLEEKYLKVARDRSLTNPLKLTTLGVSSELSSVANSFFALRRCVEHHGGVLDTDIRLSFKRFSLLIRGDEVTSLPQHMDAGDALGMGIVDEQKTLAAGQKVTLTEDVIDHIATTIHLIAREIYTAAVG